jgi:hypothetical protein
LAEGLPLTQAQPLAPPLQGTLLRCNSDCVGVLVEHHSRRLVAIRPVPAGTRLFAITGRETKVPTRYSLQVGRSLHLDQECARDEFDLVMNYFWRYMDHSCEPTTVIRARKVVTVREMSEGDGVTFDYNTTEYDMAEPFRCHCGSPSCVGTVRGALHLAPARRAELAQRLPKYLR